MNTTHDRSKKILNAIVQDYIQTAEPVSSRAIAVKYPMGLSPATIRNIMAELEDQGYLVQPHTSAGRVPTDKGFRLYIDSLGALDEPLNEQKELIRKSCETPANIEAALMDTARALSILTNCAGLMFVPKRESFVIKQISMLPVDRTSVMALFVSTRGLVQTRVIRLDAGSSTLSLESASNYLNSIASGLTMRELRAKIVEEMRDVKNLYDELLAGALKLGAMAADETAEDGLYVEGKVNIFEQPEFRADFERMKKLFAAFEEKNLLLKILDKSVEESGIHIYLGSESLVSEFEGLSFVTAPYARGGETIGALGVVGPVRMDYARIIPLVDYTAGLLCKVFQ